MTSMSCCSGYVMTNVEVCSDSDTGVKEPNEDTIIVRELAGCYLLGVADGIGGHSAGEIASSVAAREIQESVVTNLESAEMHEALVKAIAKANSEVHLLSIENSEYQGMGTTIVLALIREGTAVVANVGDSRAYHVSAGGIRRITADHTAVEALRERGLIDEEQARSHPDRNVLNRALGTGPTVKPDVHDVRFRSGDILLLCSDGLSDSLRDDEITEAIVTAQTLGAACGSLIERARANGATDDISVILAWQT